MMYFEDSETWQLERRHDGSVIVRVPSARRHGQKKLPDAVFSFRRGDPQYRFWDERLRAQESRAS
jgi:hypothetical protein